MNLPRPVPHALAQVRAAMDVTQQTIDAINDLREPVDVGKLSGLRDREDEAWRELEDAWRQRRGRDDQP